MRWIPAISGVVATAAAVVVLLSVPQSQVVEAVPTPIVTPADIVAATAPTRLVEISPSVTPEVPELGSSVADVLAEGGFTEFVGSTELGRTLPESVVDVLVAEGVVLVVPKIVPDNGGS